MQRRLLIALAFVAAGLLLIVAGRALVRGSRAGADLGPIPLPVGEGSPPPATGQ